VTVIPEDAIDGGIYMLIFFIVLWLYSSFQYANAEVAAAPPAAWNAESSITADKAKNAASGEKSKSDKPIISEEHLLLSFEIENSGKIASICLSENEDYIVYRFGTAVKTELEIYARESEEWGNFNYSCYPRVDSAREVKYNYSGNSKNKMAGVDLHYMSFKNGDYTYTVYEERYTPDNIPKTGVIITNFATGKTTRLAAAEDSQRGSLAYIINDPGAPEFLLNRMAIIEPLAYHTVNAGNTLARIADIYYGNHRYFTLIEQANDMVGVGSIKIGQVLIIPPKPESLE